jgi:hypothetical protein
MYSPIQDGIAKTVQAVRYSEAKPQDKLSGLVHCYWELRTDGILPEDFHLHAIPDACVNILFNQLDPNIAGVTALRTTFESLNLGKSFHYVGIQFFPGVWQGNQGEITDRFVGTTYAGQLPLIGVGNDLAKFDFTGKQPVMAKLVEWLVDQRLVIPNKVTERILKNIDEIRTVADMALIACLSHRVFAA